MQKLKAIVFVMIIIFITNIAYAGISAILTGYDSESHKAKIQLYNDGNSDYHNIYLKIGSTDYGKIVDIIVSGNSAVVFKNLVQRPNHLIITTDEGVFEQDITPFVKAVPTVEKNTSAPITTTQAMKNSVILEKMQQEIEYKKKIDEAKLEEQKAAMTSKVLPPEPAETPIPVNKPTNKLLMITLVGVAVLIFIFVIWYIIRMGRGKLK
jgi:hypothetical protein